MQRFLISIKDFMDPTIFALIILISIFELFVDRPALKSQGLIRDAKITALVAIGWVVLAVAMAIIARTVR